MLPLCATTMRRAGRAACSMILVAVAVAASACSGSDSTAPEKPNGGTVVPAPVASVSMSPAQASLAIASTQQLAVTVRDAAGAELTGRARSFASSAPTIASVSQGGLVTAVAAGQADITVTVEGKSAQSSITVQPAAPAPVASVTLSPATVTLDAGETANLSARVADAANNALAGRAVAWASASPSVATVDQAGKVTAIGAGTARITATSEGKQGEALVQVVVRRVVASVQITGALDTLEAYDVRNLRAVARDAAGEIIPDVPFVWTSSNVAVATVENPAGALDGTITGVDRGTVTVTATSPNGKSATATRVVVIRYRSITTATMHSCDIASGGIAWCWGLNSTDARLGDSNIGDGKFRAEPFRVPGERGFTQLVSFARFTCGLKTDRKAYCWGNNSWGTLGDGSNRNYSATPVAVAGNNTFLTLTAGADHACGITTTNALVCWGHNDWGQFGVGNTSTPNGPVVAAAGMQFRAVMASSAASCGVTLSGTAYCWGGNGNGEAGDGERIAYGNVYKTTPSLVVGGLTFESITGGNHYTCGLTTSKTAHCWGSNGGRFGSGNTTDSSSPVAVAGGHLFTQISSGYGHSCGVTTASDVACWGGNSNGQIGTTSQTLRVPYLIPNLKAAEVAASGIGTGAGSHSCAIARDRLTVLCWGRNDVGQLGNGLTTSVPAINATPSIVVGQKPL